MFLQLSAPRFIVRMNEHPEHIVIHTLKKAEVSAGTVLFNMNTDIEHGTRSSVYVEPHLNYNLSAGFEVLEYYLPFHEIFGTKKPVYDERALLAREYEKIRTGNYKALPSSTSALVTGKRKYFQEEFPKLRGTQLALLLASGVSIVAKTAIRVSAKEYSERVTNFQLMFPVTGGGFVRFSETIMDLMNPTFNPYAAPPDPTVNQETWDAYLRTHGMFHRPSSDVEARRQARIASANASIAQDIDATLLGPKKEE